MSDIVRIVVGALFGFLCSVVLSPAFAGFGMKGGASASVLLVLITGGAAAGYYAPSMRRAFGRSFLALGICLLLLPVSTFILAGSAFNETVNKSAETDQAAAVIGAGAAVAAVTGAATFFGIILGMICVIIGVVLALGGRREIVIIQK